MQNINSQLVTSMVQKHFFIKNSLIVTGRCYSEFCKKHCQPNESGNCVIYNIDNEGGAGIYTCGEGVLIYDGEVEQPND